MHYVWKVVVVGGKGGRGGAALACAEHLNAMNLVLCLKSTQMQKYCILHIWKYCSAGIRQKMGVK